MNNTFLLEVGVEELPARFVLNAVKQLQTLTQKWLKDHKINFETVETYSTPRRLAIIVHNIDENQATVTEKVRGPHIGIAKDKEGQWTKAAIGFTKGQGKSIEDIFTETVKDKEYIFIEKTTNGKKTSDILEHIHEVIDQIHFPQTMNWGAKSYRFARPIRWLVALLNNQVIPTELAGIQSNRHTYGHRFLGGKIEINQARDYESVLKDQYVIPKYEERQKLITDAISQHEKEQAVKVVVEEDLLEEVTNLVEYPTLFIGQFSEQYLNLPEEVLITSMKEHQRYFPVFDTKGKKLLAYFVGIRNGDANHLDNVVKGNEKVLRARLQDGEFFYEEDQKRSIEFFDAKLENVVFQEKIGTVAEKVVNVMQLTQILSDTLNLDESTSQHALRAAEISKFDLMTNMVNEFTELQGVMGEKYALIFGENPKVAQAIREHYLPTSAQGEVPNTLEGAIVAISDKLVTVMSCFNVGIEPTGSQDPLGLRRQSNGILNILKKFNWHISIENLIELGNRIFKIEDSVVLDKLKHFFKERMIYLFTLEGNENDIIQSVLANELGIISTQEEKIKLLAHLKYDESFKATQASLVRVINLAKKHLSTNEINPDLFETQSETDLYKVLRSKETSILNAMKENAFEFVLDELQAMADPVNLFFEENMVMAEDESIKANRIALLNRIAELIMNFGDITKVEWKQMH